MINKAEACDTLILFYITNNPEVALIAEKCGVDRIWIDLEVLGKEKRQHNMDTVKSHHTIDDISRIKPLLSQSELMVRINPWNVDSNNEINSVIDMGADIIMLPYWKTVDEVKGFLKTVRGRCKTSLLLETKEAVDCIDKILSIGGFDEIHIGLNDLHISYGLTFMFELLTNGLVDYLCEKFRNAGIPYGFGGIARLGGGLIPAERIIMEHYRLGSTRAILSRSFCDTSKVDSIEMIAKLFDENMKSLRNFEQSLKNVTEDELKKNRLEIISATDNIVKNLNKSN